MNTHIRLRGPSKALSEASKQVRFTHENALKNSNRGSLSLQQETFGETEATGDRNSSSKTSPETRKENFAAAAWLSHGQVAVAANRKCAQIKPSEEYRKKHVLSQFRGQERRPCAVFPFESIATQGHLFRLCVRPSGSNGAMQAC